jgi:small-conductance mechanosensitive channel
MRLYPKNLIQIAISLFILIAGSLSFAEDTPESPIDEKYTLPYLEQTISWYRSITSLEVSPTNPQEILFDETLRKNASKVLNSAFDFAKIEATALDAKSDDGTKSPTQTGSKSTNLAKAISDAEQKIKDLQSALVDISAKIAKASAKTRPILLARQDKLESELNLVKARQELLQTVIGQSNSASAEEAGLVGKINKLARSLPEVLNEEQKSTAAKPETAANIAPPQEVIPLSEKGIFALTSDIYAISLKTKTISNLIDSNIKLRADNQHIIDLLRAQLKEKMQQGEDISKETAGEDIHGLATQKQNLDNLVTDYKKLGSIIIPLRKMNLWLDATGHNLDDWRNLLERQSKSILERLLLKLGVLSIAILIPVILSIIAHKATVKYVKNARLEKQLKTLRRSIFAGVIGLIVILNLISESGSLITFAGFLTAGIAVALQTVILSVVAHFFFIGKYGVRVGDRVSIGGVTGEVIKIGMVRFYLMELAGADFDLNPTGKIIAYPNSVLFQPAAFIKLIPGTNYTWNEVKLTLDPNTDYNLANKKLMEAVDKVYKDYRDVMKKQEQALQKATSSHVTIPEPQGHLRIADSGLSFVVRYPIAISKAVEIRDRMTKQLLETIKSEKLIK